METFLVLLAALGVAVRTALGAIFLFAGVAKLRDLAGFEQAVAGYRLLPEFLVTPFARALPFLELGVAIAIWVAPIRPVGVAVAIVLLLAFATAMAINIRRGRTHIDCGCGQGLASQTISRGVALRNVVLAILSGLAFVPETGLGGLALANCVAAGLLLFGLHILLDMVLALVARPRRREKSAWSQT